MTPRRFAITLCLLGAVMIVVFLPALRRLYPLGNDVSPSGDDWWSYHRYAVSVVQHGAGMPAVEGPYTRPGGFGYVYFVAACYAIFGERSEVVYVVQALLLIAAVLGFVSAFRTRVPPLVYGLLLIVFVYLDTFRFYTFRLLSENLLIFLLALLFMALERIRSWPAAIAVGLLCGACFLTRPNTVLLAPAFALLLARRKRWRDAAIVLAGLVLMGSLIVWRDYVATGALDLRVLTTRQDWPRPSVALYGKRILYVLGYLRALIPEFGPLWRWVVAWACLPLLAFGRRRLDDFDHLALVFVAAYYVPLIAVGDIANYGIRMLMPAMPVVLFLAVRGVKTAADRRPSARRNRDRPSKGRHPS